MASKIVLITGCSKGGIGYELCFAFHGKGHKVFATARDLKKLDDLPEDIGRLQIDVTDGLSVENAVQVRRFGRRLTGIESHQ
jgi:1-acylglycerone phosphate reductase